VLSTLALHMQTVAVGWQLYTLTGSALDLGLLGLVQFVPTITLTLVGGHVADRSDRRVVVVVCQVAQTGASVALALGSHGGWLGRTSILAIVGVLGAAQAFANPSRTALLPRLVPLAQIPRAIASVTSATQTARIVGPALGGLLYDFGPVMVYLTVAALYLVGAALIAIIRDQPSAREREETTLASLFSGVVFIFSRRLLWGLISLDLFAVLLGGATALLPIYARDILGTGPWGLGLLRAAPAIGALVSSIVLARRPVQHGAGPIFFGAVLVFGVATIVFGVSTNLLVSLAALTVLGGADLLSVVIRHSLVQMRTPDAMRGRVSAVHSVSTNTSNQLGEFESGLLAALLGPVPAVVLGGVGTIIVAALWMYRFPELRRFHLADS
jgi:MFS family permease